jgi:hypothetical protein
MMWQKDNYLRQGNIVSIYMRYQYHSNLLHAVKKIQEISFSYNYMKMVYYYFY